MRTQTGPVLAATMLLSAPILWETLLTGAWPTDAALLRCAAIAAGCWLSFGALAALLRATDDRTSPETGRPAGVASSDSAGGTAPGDVPGSPAGRVTAVDSPAGR